MSDLGTFLTDLGDLSEAVLMNVELTNYHRDVRLTLDRVIDPVTGILIQEPGRRVVWLELMRCEAMWIDNALPDTWWGPESGWGIDEIIEAVVVPAGEGQVLLLRWSGDERRMSFRFREARWGFLSPDDQGRALFQYWGAPD